MTASLRRIAPTHQLDPIDLVVPGSRGMNTVQAAALLDPLYAVTAQNAVIDTSGRLGARQGTTSLTNTPIGGQPTVQSIFEYNQGGGTYQSIAAWNGAITNNLAIPTNNLGGAVVVANGRWFFANFNNKCIGFQSGQKLIVYNGAGTFANVVESQGTAPTGGIGCAAFGRIWQLASDGQTVRYSGLLDETDWGSASSGTIDMHTIWADGTDTVTAIFAFNAALVICGNKHIVMFTDGRGSMLGLDPTQAYVFDTLLGTGCTSQWTVDHIGESDVVFLSSNGVQSLQRLLSNRDNPVETLTKYVRDDLLNLVAQETPSAISGAFNPTTGFYILGLPKSGFTWCLDMRRKYTDDIGALCSPVTLWTMFTAACTTTHVQATYICKVGTGTVDVYSGFADSGEGQYNFVWLSPWMNLGQDVAARLKMMKRLTFILFTSGNVTFTSSWGVDFNASFAGTGFVSQTVALQGSNSQYGIGQYGISQYGGSASLYLYKTPAHVRGQYYQIGISATITGPFALQQAQIAAKVGRVA